MKEWNEHRNECASIYDRKWSEMEATRNIFDGIVGGMTIDQLKIEKEKWERGGFIGGKDELLNRWIGEQSQYRQEMLEDVMENHREWAKDEAEQTFKYTVIVDELNRRISEKTVNGLLKDLGQPFLSRIGWTEKDTEELTELVETL